MTTLTTEYQDLASGSYTGNTGVAYTVKLQAKYGNVSGNTCTVYYRLLVNAAVWTTATAYTNSNVLNGTGATSQSASGGTFTLNAGDNIIYEISASGITGGSSVSESGGYYMGYYNWGSTSLSGSATVPTFATAPTGLSCSDVVAGVDEFSATVSVSAWGTGSGTKYRELQCWTYDASSLVEPRRYQAVTGSTTSGTITVSNSSSGSLTITGNTRYTLGVYASNGSMNTGSQRVGDYVTLASAFQYTVTVNDSTSATLHWASTEDGGYYVKTYQYSIDGGSTWTTITTVTGSTIVEGDYVLTGLSADTSYTVQTRVVTTAGTTTGSSMSFTTDPAERAFYCSGDMESGGTRSFSTATENVDLDNLTFSAATFDATAGTDFENYGSTATIATFTLDFRYSMRAVTVETNAGYSDPQPGLSTNEAIAVLQSYGLSFTAMNIGSTKATITVTATDTPTILSGVTRPVQHFYFSKDNATKGVWKLYAGGSDGESHLVFQDDDFKPAS